MSLSDDIQQSFKTDALATAHQLMEKITGFFAAQLIDQSGIRQSRKRPLKIFDNGCGGGIVSSVLSEVIDRDLQSEWELTCGDISEGMVAIAANRSKDEAWHNARVVRLDSQNSGLPDTQYTHMFSGFVFMALPKYHEALDDAFRVLEPGGTIALSTWRQVSWVDPVRSAVESLPGNLPFPTSREFLEMFSGAWYDEGWIRETLAQHAFHNVQTVTVCREISLHVSEICQVVSLMLPMALPRIWTAEQRDKNEALIEPALTKHLEGQYGANGLVPLELIAILSTGRKSA